MLESTQKARPEALALANAMFDLHEARAALKTAKASVPNYTGDRQDIDYYRAELIMFNEAVNAYADAVRVIATTEPTDMTDYYEHQVGMSIPVEDLGVTNLTVKRLRDNNVYFVGDLFKFVTKDDTTSHNWFRIAPILSDDADAQTTLMHQVTNRIARDLNLRLDTDLTGWKRPEIAQ